MIKATLMTKEGKRFEVELKKAYDLEHARNIVEGIAKKRKATVVTIIDTGDLNYD